MQNTTIHKSLATIIALFFLLIAATQTAFAQTNTTFTYQGRLTDNSTLASGPYDLQFALYDAVSAGAQQGANVTLSNVAVTNGIFTVALDFGSTPFATGAPRFLQIGVRPGGSSSAFTLLTPRQALAPTPYALHSLNAEQLGGVNANQYVTGPVVSGVNGLSGNVTLAAGANVTLTPSGNTLTIAATGGSSSGNFIQNTTTTQAASNFNISGDGTAGGTLSGNVVNAATQFNLNGARILSNAGGVNLFAGESAGAANTVGFFNAFFGARAGQFNTTGGNNTFVGATAGQFNTTGGNNAFVGTQAGTSNTTGNSNAFVGYQAGVSNTTGNSNAFVGTQAGLSNTTGSDNAFVGGRAGFSNTTGDSNAFFGTLAGQFNTTGLNNVFVGRSAGVSNTTGAFNTFIGRQAGLNVASGNGNVFLGNDTGVNNRTGSSNTLIGSGANVASDGLSFATAIGAGATVSTNNTIVLGRSSDGVYVPGPLLASGNLILNDTQLRLRGANDSNHAIVYNSNFDGIEFRANDQFIWSRANGNTVQMVLHGNGVLATRSGFHGRCASGQYAPPGLDCNQDLAETFRTKEQTEAGDVVTIIPQDHERPTVRRSLRAYDEHLVGVVSTNPGLVFDEGDTRLAGANDHYITKDKTVVAAVGRVPVKFTLENGAINVGDPLTSSATEPGKAMKATGAGKIIGIALESSAKAKDGKLLLWLQVGHYAPQQGDELKAIRAENAELTARNTALAAQLQQQQTRTAALETQQQQQQTRAAAIEAQLSVLLTRLAQSGPAEQEKRHQ